MQTTNGNTKTSTSNPEWRFLGEYPLNELMVEMAARDRTDTSLLFQTIRDLGVHPEFSSSIECKLMGLANEAMAHFNQGIIASRYCVRLFYQKKMIGTENTVNSSRQFNEQLPVEPNQMIHQADSGINGGWGYFLIERAGAYPTGSMVGTYHWIDLYLYNEGE